MPNVTVIPATRNLHTGVRNDAVAKRKTAGYARVSTDSEEQLTSYEAQVDYYISTRDAAKKWGISERRVQKLCEENRIEGVLRFGHSWMIPKLSSKPVDLRRKNSNIPSDEKYDI